MKPRGLSVESCGSPLDVARIGIAPPQFTTRRTRTISVTARIDEAELQDGVVLAFSRTKGHGFLKPVDKEGYQEFFHVSDVTSEIVPKEGDVVKYRLIAIPPKYSKFQAVQVTVVDEKKLLEGGRAKWGDFVHPPKDTPQTPPPTPNE